MIVSASGAGWEHYNVSDAGRYKDYWELLKKNKKVALKVYPKNVRTLVRMITKEKNEDLAFRLLCLETQENWVIKPNYHVLQEEGKVLVNFVLKLKLHKTRL